MYWEPSPCHDVNLFSFLFHFRSCTCTIVQVSSQQDLYICRQVVEVLGTVGISGGFMEESLKDNTAC